MSCPKSVLLAKKPGHFFPPTHYHNDVLLRGVLVVLQPTACVPRGHDRHHPLYGLGGGGVGAWVGACRGWVVLARGEGGWVYWQGGKNAPPPPTPLLLLIWSDNFLQRERWLNQPVGIPPTSSSIFIVAIGMNCHPIIQPVANGMNCHPVIQPGHSSSKLQLGWIVIQLSNQLINLHSYNWDELSSSYPISLFIFKVAIGMNGHPVIQPGHPSA